VVFVPHQSPSRCLLALIGDVNLVRHWVHRHAKRLAFPAATVVVVFVAPSITVTSLLVFIRHVNLVRRRVHCQGNGVAPAATVMFVIVAFVAPSITVTLLLPRLAA